MSIVKKGKNWFILNPKSRVEKKILHPASYPEEIVKIFLEKYTNERDWILDPFLGTGSTIIAAKELNRFGVGIELLEKYALIAQKRLYPPLDIYEEEDSRKETIDKFFSLWKIIIGDSLNIDKLLISEFNGAPPKFKAIITSPPYWNQLKRNYIRQKQRKEKGLDTIYSENINDLGNIDDYEEFLKKQTEVFKKAENFVMKDGILIIITNNVFFNGKMYPLAQDTILSIQSNTKFEYKTQFLWLQNDKSLLPLGVGNAWVGNRHHQYCLVFTKRNV